MELSRLKIHCSSLMTWCTASVPSSRLASAASSFNLDAVKTVGRVSAYEAADDGLNMTGRRWLTSRDPRWGRARRLWKISYSNLHHGAKPWWKRCRAKSGRSLLGDDQRQALCRLRRGGEAVKSTTPST